MVERGRFSGRAAVVTGGSGGIGRELCTGLAREGAAVAVVDVDKSAAVEVAERLAREHRVAAEGFGVDVREPAAVAELMAAAHGLAGRLDFLVTLAGGSLGTPKDLSAIEPEHVDLVMDVNIKGTFYCCQAAAPYLATHGGAIVTTSSIGGRQPSPVTGVPYATSKAAVVGLTKRLARELGEHGVRVNAVAPGLFLTGRLQTMYAALPEAERREVLDAIPLRRFPEIRELVEPILFLLSEESSYITGVVLDVNGGRFMPL